MDLKKLELQKSMRGNRGSKKKIIKFWLIILIPIFLIGGVFIWSLFSSTSSVSNFVFSVNPLKPQPDRVNILLLGNAGGVHDGPSLTDSIIIASYHLKTNKVTLISIPRDLWVDNNKAKANAIYEIGERHNEGLKLVKTEIGEILDLPIDYGIRLDFNGFSKAIDLVEGLDIEVPNTFDDYNYPIEGMEDDLCGYKEEEVELTDEKIKELNVATPLPSNSILGFELLVPGKRKVFISPDGKIATESGNLVFKCRLEHINFVKGNTHMDGETALKFVRSRMGTNSEGSDFARSRRQQLILQAFRAKALSLETLVNPVKVTGLVSTLGNSIETDIPPDKYIELYTLIKKMDQVESLVLGDLKTGEPLLITPSPADYGGAFVLIPKAGDFSKIRLFLKERLDPNLVFSSPSLQSSVMPLSSGNPKEK